MAPALREAIGIPAEEGTARSIVVITDGYVSNDNEIIDMVNENMDKAGFFSFGIGSSVNDYLIKGIAGAGLGEAFVVTDKEDAEEAARNFRTYIESPLLTDITVDYGKFDVYDVETTVPSVLYARRPIVIFGKCRQPGLCAGDFSGRCKCGYGRGGGPLSLGQDPSGPAGRIRQCTKRRFRERGNYPSGA